MAIDARELRNVMGHFVTGVTVITTRDTAGKPFGLTANAFSSLSLDPPLVLICVDKTVDCYACFEGSRVFAVNFLSEEQEHLSRRFATKGIEKFEGLAYKTGECGAPLLEGAMGHIECKLINGYDGGDHTIYVGEIQSAAASGERPLLFFKGKYYRLPQ
ncbi:MAG TPA: flavin reductase family protein [Candidatus Binatia bacterium]|nr:flavin reductase family protein [Candidatus Binatia bacterium]